MVGRYGDGGRRAVGRGKERPLKKKKHPSPPPPSAKCRVGEEISLSLPRGRNLRLQESDDAPWDRHRGREGGVEGGSVRTGPTKWSPGEVSG